MGPMGPMMGWANGTGGAAALIAVVILAAVMFAVLVAISNRQATGTRAARAPKQRPEDVLRERYARGEIGWATYRDALENLLKDCYIRGELDLMEFEERLARLLRSGTADATDASSERDLETLKRVRGDSDRVER